MTDLSASCNRVPEFFGTYLGVIVLGWLMWIGFGLFIAACGLIGAAWK